MQKAAHQNLKVVQALAPASYSAAAEAFTSGIDCKGFEEALIIFNLGAFTATGDVSFQVEESSDDGSADAYADVSGAAAPTSGDYDTNEDSTVYVMSLDLKQRERYIRIGYDVDDDAAIFGITVILCGARELPVSQANTAISIR